MSADPDKDTACPKADKLVAGTGFAEGDTCHEITEKKRKKPSRSVRFPDDNQLVTQYFEPANPWHDVPTTTRAQLAAEYLEACRRHNTPPIDSVLHQIRELPENAIGGGNRAARLTLAACSLEGAAPADSLEALLRKVQFRRVELEHAEVDDEGAEAIFDMIEFYESANVVSISGPRQFGIRGWQAACRMIKKSAELSEIEVCDSELCASHAPVLVRALRPHTCRLRALCLQRVALQGEPLLCLVIALKSNSSIRELRLPDNELSVTDALQLGSLLRFNLNIQLLDLSNNQIQDAGAGYIADALVEQAGQTPPSAATSPLSPHHYPLGYESRVGLAFLVLWNNQLTRNCAPHLSRALRSSQSLCVLNIGRNALGTESVRALCGGGALVSLGLQCARLGPDAAKPLAELVRADTKLQRLDLRDNRLGVVGLQAILNAMKENTTLTQIDLDDPVESTTLSAEDSEAATVARLSRDIVAACRKNEPPATEPERRVHRKISLTCHTAFVPKSGPGAAEAARRSSRLRSPAPSPAPSPAGSPTPHNQHTSRFSVTRVTPERESSQDSTSPSTPTRPSYCLTPSRFKVVQVAEPPQIQVHLASQKRTSSRFSVTRNYDAIYNSSSPSGSSPSASPTPSVSPVPSASPTPGFSVSPTPGFSVSPTPGSASATPVSSRSPTPGGCALTDISASPTVVISASPAKIGDLPTDINALPICVSALPTDISASPTVMGGLPTVTPVMLSYSVTTGVSSATPTAMTSGSPTVIISAPEVLSQTTGVASASTDVISGSPTPGVLTQSPTPSIFTGTPSFQVNASSMVGVQTSSSPTSGALTSASSTQEILTTVSPTVMTAVQTMTGVPTVTTVSPVISACATPLIMSCVALTQGTTISASPTCVSTSTVILNISSSQSSGLVTSSVKASMSPSLTAVPYASPTVSLPGCVSPVTQGPFISEHIGIGTSQNIDIRKSQNIDIGTSQHIDIGNTQNIDIRKSQYIDIGTSQKIAGVDKIPVPDSKICSDTDVLSGVGCLRNSSNIGISDSTYSKIGTIPVEDIWKNAAATVKSSDDILSTILSGTPSNITMVGTVTKTSTGTLKGSNSSGIPICEACSSDTKSIVTSLEYNVPISPKESELYSRSESLIKFTDIGSKSSPISIDRLESRVGQTAIPKSTFPLDVVPNSRFSISPNPDNFGVYLNEQSDNNPNEDISKSVAKGSHTNIVATDVQIESNIVTRNIEADILTKIAEFTETIGPKVVETEPKDIPKAINIDKDVRMQHIAENNPISRTSISRNIVSESNSPMTGVTSLIDISSNIGSTTQECNDVDKSMTERAKLQIMPKEYVSIPKDTPDKIQFTEQIKTENTCLDDKVRLTTDTKQTEVSLPKKESVIDKEVIDKIDLKSILKDDFKYTELKTELSKSIVKETIIEEAESSISSDMASKLEDRNSADSRKSDSVKDNSDAKMSDRSDESVKNKTYSDVVKSDPKYKDKSEQLTHREEISDSVVKTETKLVRNSVEVTGSDKVDVQAEITVKKESVQNATKVHSDQNKDFVNIDDIILKKDVRTMKQIEAITEDLGNLIQEMKHMSSKSRKVKSDCTVDIVSVDTNKVPGNFNRDVVLKKNKSESSLDSPDMEVSRLMNKKLVGSPFCDSSSSLEISGSSMESLNAIENHHALCHVISKPVVIQESIESDTELDRRKDAALSTESSMETSEVTPVNMGNFLNMSVSSNESVSPILFGMKKKIHDSLSSLEASMSSLDSGRQEKVMVTSADSGIEYSLQQPSENKEDNSSNEGTLTHNSSLKETVKKTDQETLTSSPKRTSSLLDVPALKTKGLDRMRKISWVAPSSSFHIPRVEAEKLEKPSHLEKLLSLFQHPTSLFSRGSQSDEERKSASNTPPRKDPSLTSSFWSWGSTIEKEKDDREDSSEATDSTLSERVQVSFVDESFSKKLDSKTPSTDTDNTLSEFQSFPTQTTEDECKEKVTDDTTDENLVQKCLGLSLNTDTSSSNGNRDTPRASDMTDLSKPNDMNRNYEVASDGNKNDTDDAENKTENRVIIDKDETKLEPIRPRSFAAVLKSSGSENSLDKQPSPDSGQPVDKLPSKVIRGIKENISPENTLTSSMTNTKTLALELSERQVKSQAIVNVAWELTNPTLDKTEFKTEDVKTHSDLAPIATIDETCDEAADNTVNIQLDFIDDVKTDDKSVTTGAEKDKTSTATRLDNVDLGKDALSYLIYESQDFEPDTEHAVAARTVEEGSLAQELKEAEIKEMLDLSPELVIDEAIEIPEAFNANEIKGMKSSPVIPERAKLKKSNSLEDLSQRQEPEKNPKTKTIAFKVPETSPCNIPERRPKLRTMSPKSLPESLNKPSPLVKLDTALKKRKKVSSLGKMAKDSLLALNMSEEEIAEYRRSYVTSVESLRSLESVSEDANSQSGTSVDSRCRACLRTSQESLMSLDSITEDCKCASDGEKPSRCLR